MKNKENLTTKEAYQAMLFFLDSLYEKTLSSDLGGFLGGFQMCDDGTTIDPAAWNNWRKAVNNVLEKRLGKVSD